jgi:hypothetical protein
MGAVDRRHDDLHAGCLINYLRSAGLARHNATDTFVST